MRTIAEIFNDCGYLAYNYAFKCVMDSEGFDRQGMLAEHAKLVAQRKEAQGLLNTSSADLVFIAWLENASLHLINQLATASENECAPRFAMTLEGMNAVATFLCQLTVPGLAGIATPARRPRWTDAPGGHVLDIVSVDPRQGWGDIPDWQDFLKN